MVMWAVDRFRRYGRYNERGKLFLDQSIGIDETNTFYLSRMKIVGATDLGGLWVTNLRCVQSYEF